MQVSLQNVTGFSVKFDERQMNNLKLILVAKSENKISQVSESIRSVWFINNDSTIVKVSILLWEDSQTQIIKYINNLIIMHTVDVLEDFNN